MSRNQYEIFECPKVEAAEKKYIDALKAAQKRIRTPKIDGILVLVKSADVISTIGYGCGCPCCIERHIDALKDLQNKKINENSERVH